MALLLDLPSKWQIWDWVEKGILIGFLMGGAMVLVHETHSHVQKTLLSCDFRAGGTLAGAVAASDVRCVDHWLRQVAPVDRGEQPLLHVAVAADNALVLSRLLDSGRFNPNQPAAHGDTSLHAAVRKGRRDMVCLLLSHGSNRHFPNGDHVTPLDLAADRDRVALLEGDVCLRQKP